MPPRHEPSSNDNLLRVRLDKWLWAARFFKTRALSCEAIEKNRVMVNDAPVKPAREVRIGDIIKVRVGPSTRTIKVLALSGVRGSASVAALLFEETAESIELRMRLAESHRLAPEPASTIAQGRPTKRDRRLIESLGSRHPTPNWNDRWSASLDDE